MKETITFVACKDARQAKKIASTLVSEKLAACVNVLPGVHSTYAWKGKIAQAREVLLLIKSRATLSKRLASRVRQLHSYSVPEVVTVAIVSGNPDYLRWVRVSTR